MGKRSHGCAASEPHLGIRAMPPGGKEEHELGWFGWSLPRDISRDGKKVLFEEEADGGGPNYTVFLRDTDGSPPVRIGDGTGEAISPDNKWVITKPAKGGPLSLVPTGAGEAKQLTHDNISYSAVRYLPDGKQLLAVGIEAGHGARDYLIDLSSGDAKPITPEGVTGARLSADGRSTAALRAGRQMGRLAAGRRRLAPYSGAGLEVLRHRLGARWGVSVCALQPGA